MIMNELATSSLARIATANHLAAAIFEKYNLDFCCKGKQSLQQACEEKKLPLEVVAAELNSLHDSRLQVNFEEISLTQLADHIISAHHQYVKKEIPQIKALLLKVNSKHGSHFPELKEILDAFLMIE